MAHIVEYILQFKDKMSGSLSKAAASLASVHSRMTALNAQSRNATNSINYLNDKISRLHEQRNSSTAIDQIRRLNGEIRGLERQAARLENMPPDGFINRIRYAHGGLGDMLKLAGRTYGAMQAWGAIKSFAQLGLDMEQTRAKFEVLLGSAEKGNKMIADIGELAKSTPLDKGGLTANAETLLAFNVSGKKIIPTLKMLGDVAMGNKEKMKGLTLAYAQMMSTGKLMGQDLLQMINQGFNPLVEISKKTGKSMEVLKDAMGKGAISSAMVEEAFRSATSEGGQFHGMMEKMSQTGMGKLTQALGTMQDRLTEFSEKLTPMFGVIVDWGSKIMDWILGVIPHLEAFGAGLSRLWEVFRDNIAVLFTLAAAYAQYRIMVWASTLATTGWTVASKLQYYWLLMCEKAQKLLNATILKHPFIAAVAGIALLVGWLIKMRQKTDENTEAMKRAKSTSESYYAREKVHLDAMFAKLKQTLPKSRERNKLVDELKQMYPELNERMERELRNTNNLATAYDALAASIAKKARIKGMEAALESLGTRTSDFDMTIEDLVAKAPAADRARLREEYRKEAKKLASIHDKGTWTAGGFTQVQKDVMSALGFKWNNTWTTDKKGRTRSFISAMPAGVKDALAAYDEITKIQKFLASFMDDGSGGSGGGGSSSADPFSTISGLTSGGKKDTNIHINFRNLIETLNMYPQALREGVDDVADKLTEGLLKVVNSANRAAQ